VKISEEETMAESNSTTGVEKERADRFPLARASYVVWTRQQGEKLRQIKSNEQINTGEPGPTEAEEITDKFNA
jgi:hypothetical protein